MEEDPQDHDFDQRQDGPFQRPTVHIDTNVPSRQSQDHARTAPPEQARGRSLPDVFPKDSPVEPARHSTQITRAHASTPGSPPGRKSTQISRGRSSRDFDVRRDGPFGRPSATISRRKSSGTVVPMQDGRTPSAPPPEEVKEEDEAAAQAPVSLETLQASNDAAFEPEPPPLNYTLRTRKRSIIFFWSLILIDCIAMPIALYFGLKFGTDLSPNTVFSIVTAALGGVSILEYILRFHRLWRKGSTCRVIGARRMYLDWFHWNFSLGWAVIMVELIVGTIPTHPPIRLLSMPLSSMCYAFGTELLAVDIMRYFEIPAPVRISSIPKGAQLRPGIYSVIEDVCAVDGSGGTAFREALNKRYEASHVFRAMLRRLGVFWAVGAEGVAVLTTILVFTIEHNAAYVVGWTVPFIWAGIWTAATFWYVKRTLKEEQTAWAEEVAAKSQA